MFYTLSCVVQFKLRIPQLKDFLGNLDKHFLEGINDLIEHKYFLKVHAPETLQTTISNRPMRICSKAASMTCKCCELQSMNNCFHSLTVIFPFHVHFSTENGHAIFLVGSKLILDAYLESSIYTYMYISILGFKISLKIIFFEL